MKTIKYSLLTIKNNSTTLTLLSGLAVVVSCLAASSTAISISLIFAIAFGTITIIKSWD